MKILIIGAGETGMALARTLIADGQRVTLVDRDPERVREASGQLDCEVLQSDDDMLDVLDRAGLASVDALVAVTASDKTNMLICSAADALCPNVKKIARVCNGDYFRNFIHLVVRCGGMCSWVTSTTGPVGMCSAGRRPPLGIDWVANPDREMMRFVMRSLVNRRRCGILDLDGGYRLLTPQLGGSSPLVGQVVGRLFEIKGWHSRLLAVDEDGKGAALVTLKTKLKAGMRLVVLAREEDTRSVLTLCDVAENEHVRILIAGAGPLVPILMGEYWDSDILANRQLARWCWRANVRRELALVDDSPDRCREYAERFPGLKVFCGDVTDPAFLREEGLDRYDVSFSPTVNHDRNLVTAAFLESLNEPCYTVALIANADRVEMARKLGVNEPVPMRETVIDFIRNHLYEQSVLKLESVANGAFDLAYLTVKRFVGIPDDAVPILAKGKDEAAFRATDAQTELQPGDRVLLMIPAGRLDELRKTFG